MKNLGLIFCAIVLMVFTGCGGGSGSTSKPAGSGTQSAVFVTGEDAPVSSVVAFNITIDKIMLNTGTTNGSSSVTVLSTPTAVDFGRLVGLRSLLGFNTVAPGTYGSATITFEAANPAPSINYVDLTTTPPSLGTAAGVLSTSTVTVAFPAGKPLIVGANGLAGLHMDFDLRDSLAIDSTGNLIINNGQIAVNPVVNVMAVAASDELGEISDFVGNVVSVNTAGNSFVLQGPYGFQLMVDVNASTQYNGSNSLSTLAANNVVAVQGTMQSDGSLMAKAVELITTDLAFISGRILAVNPGPTVTMFVGEELGTSASIPVDSVYTVNLSAVTKYDICFIGNSFTNQVFNGTSLVVGQRIFVGGTYQSNTFTPEMVSLRRQGVVGSLVPASVTVTNVNQGSFSMQNDALMSYSAGGPFTVFTGNNTVFVNINGLAGLSSAGSTNLIAGGLVVLDQQTSKPVVLAGRVRVLP
jgi:Domain of unknown function (DUF5666)/Domain of unknown function (DUF4382)